MKLLPNSQSKKLGILGLVLVTLACYWKVRNYDFVNYDDNMFVFNNTYLEDGFTVEGLKWALFSNHFLGGTTHAGYWAPLHFLSHMLDFQLYGTIAYGHHITNLVIHVLNALLVIHVLFRYTGSFWKCFFVGIVFALHPLNVESVAWIIERKGLLSTFFVLLTLEAYLEYIRGKNWKWMLLTCILFQCALMTKSTVVYVPILMLLLDHWPLNRFKRNDLRSNAWIFLEKFPLCLLALLEAIQTTLYMRNAQGIVSMDLLPLHYRVGAVFHHFWMYFERIFWPFDLSLIYPHEGHSLPIRSALLSASFFIFTSFLSILWFHKRPWFLLGWGWFVITLIPVVGILQAGAQSIANRYAYVPMVGVVFIIASAGYEFLRNRTEDWRRALNPWIIISAGVICVLLVLRTNDELSYWKDSIALFTRAIRVTKNNFVAEINLGSALREKGDLIQSENHLKEACRVAPGFPLGPFNLGITLYMEGKFDDAMKYFKAAFKDPHLRGDILFYIGNIYYESSKLEKAIYCYKKALEMKPFLPNAYYNLGHIYYDLGNIDEAIKYYHLALNTNSELDAETAYNMGLALARKGLLEDAIKFFKTSLIFNPDFAEAKEALARIESHRTLPEKTSSKGKIKSKEH